MHFILVLSKISNAFLMAEVFKNFDTDIFLTFFFDPFSFQECVLFKLST